ncbi:hypothetical protein [Jeotgalibacillus campisalis]|uniref:Uncharacterized protein n=1 Tax=Jeotgalibacillus campisalis TaxID=220754 RepID=A0A0C2RZ61_9BACL|nr:hypothetical protein [Jeotgalibacillus campisalis]KIL47074.1 hypothetical protein KR50_23960 [Jeotgalibacillus campisalis]
MEKHSDVSWKEDQVMVQLHHSVDHAAEAVGQAYTNPTKERINDAFEKIEKAERSCKNAIESRGSSEPVLELQTKLAKSKDELNQLH